MENEINATKRYPFMKATRCGAKTRRGTACQLPAVRGRKRCRMHGGTNNGAPIGSQNALKHGFTTREAKQLRQDIRALCRQIASCPKS